MTIHPPAGAIKERRRLGRGVGSGRGCTSGKGNKGQRSRSGYSGKAGFEGGQMPLSRRIPKKGFNNSIYEKKYQIINIEILNKRYNDGDVIDYDVLVKDKLVSKNNPFIKLLGKGEINKKLTVVVSKISKKAIDLIEQAGGKVEIKE